LNGKGATGAGGSAPAGIGGQGSSCLSPAHNLGYGGGGSGGNSTQGYGNNGGVRIIWPGCARQFPSTRTTNE
jgi:hypothetical protein